MTVQVSADSQALSQDLFDILVRLTEFKAETI
jgi:hypothetical protein